MKNPKNMRSIPELQLIVETDASKRTVGTSLIQEIAPEDGSKEKVLICAALRTFKSTKQDTLQLRDNFLLWFLLCRVGRYFVIRTDDRPLVDLFRKPLLSF